jgi:hypothetical protein
MSEPTLPFQKLNMKDAERYYERYLELRFQNPRMKADEICAKIGVSPNTMLRYKHMLGMEKRRSSKTTSEKQESYKKGLVTRIRNEQQKRYLNELAKSKLSAEDTQRAIDAWDREHAGIGSTPVSMPASSVSGTAESEGRRAAAGRQSSWSSSSKLPMQAL